MAQLPYVRVAVLLGPLALFVPTYFATRSELGERKPGGSVPRVTGGRRSPRRRRYRDVSATSVPVATLAAISGIQFPVVPA